MLNGRAPVPWQPSEGSRLWGYLVPMLIALPVVLFWMPLVWGLTWEAALLLDGVILVTVVGVAWLLFVRSSPMDPGARSTHPR